MPQASTSHMNYQPKVKAAPYGPPPLNKLYKFYESQDPNKQLRYGQWFFNQFVSGMAINTPYNLDALYNSTNFEVIMDIITTMYFDYQWPLA